MVSKDTDKIIRPAIFLDSTEVGGSIQRLDKVAEPEAENQDTHANQAAQATDGQMDDLVSAARVDREYAELQQEVDELMEELGGGKDGASGQSDFDAEVEGIVDDYNADPEDDNIDSAITRLHNCLVKIRSSTKQYKMFKELVAELYLGDNKRTLPSLHCATRWNSFLVELRGCVRIQKAFTRRVNEDDEGIWTGFRVRPAEWTAMNQLCQVLETAELVSLDVQAAESSIADVLFFHRILRRFMVTRLEKLHDVHEDSPAYGVKKAILAIQIKLEKYETKAKANKMVVAASILHPKRRRKPIAPSPDGESASALLGVMADRFLGKESVQPSPKPRNEPTSVSRYGVDIDSDDEDDTTVTVPDPSSSEIDIYLSGRYEWTDDYGPDTTKGALTWWRQHAQFLPRLAKLAQILLTVPSTTAIAERGFSHAGIFCSPRRNLGANSITMLTTCKLLTQSGFDPYKIDN
ncbi:hypothetical protein A4X03_0g9126, partial [Tilletia caries]